jgi:hypothetical protein
MVAYQSCRVRAPASGGRKRAQNGPGKRGKRRGTGKKILNRGNEPKDLLKTNELAFSGSKTNWFLSANEPKSNPPKGPKNQLLCGIEAKIRESKGAVRVGRHKGGYTSFEFDVSGHWKSATRADSLRGRPLGKAPDARTSKCLF